MKRSHLFPGTSRAFATWRLCSKKGYIKYMKNRSNSNFIYMYLSFQSFFVQLCKNLLSQLCFAISTKSLESVCKRVSKSLIFLFSQKLLCVRMYEGAGMVCTKLYVCVFTGRVKIFDFFAHVIDEWSLKTPEITT